MNTETGGLDDLRQPDEWDEEPVAIEVKPRRSEVVSFRLPSDELDRLEAAAAASNESLSEFIRGAIAQRINPAAEASAIDVMTGRASLVVAWHEGGQRSSRAIAEHSVSIPDFPPATVNRTG